MANKHTKRCSTSSATTDKQTKTTVRHHFTLTSVAITKSTDENGAAGDVEKSQPSDGENVKGCGRGVLE